MIKKSRPVCLAELKEILKNAEGEKAELLQEFIKRFVKMTPAEAEKLKENLDKLDIAKLKEENIVSLIDFMPEDTEDVRKILAGISLNQDETNKILETIKKKK